MKGNKRKILPPGGEEREPLELLTEGWSETKQRSEPLGAAETSGRYLTGALVVMLLSVLAAFSLLLVILALPAEREPTGGPTLSNGEEESSDTPAGVFAEDPEAAEKSVTQIYAECAPSVVSVEAARAESVGIGSGFALSANGYVATAYHVVEGAERLTVYTSDGTQYAAALVGGDELTDLAVLKIEAEGLKPLAFGSSAQLLPGDRVVAIGTPLSLSYAGSVDTGEVSHPCRTVPVYGDSGALLKKMTLLQTNASLNPGNSGCPLLNGRGQVVGIVTLRLSDQADGMGFAIPSDGAAPILTALQNGSALSDTLLSAVAVRAPKLGVVGERAEADGSFGVRILRFAAGNYDVMSKLKISDVILTLGGKAVPTPARLSAAIAEHAPWEAVEVTVLRAGQRLTFSVILGI